MSQENPSGELSGGGWKFSPELLSRAYLCYEVNQLPDAWGNFSRLCKLPQIVLRWENANGKKAQTAADRRQAACVTEFGLVAMYITFPIGYGLIFPLASAVITDLFEGAKKDTMMGWKSAIGALAGVVFQTLGGVLTAYSWRFAFLGFLLVIPILIMVLIFLPDTGVKAKAEGKKQGGFTKGLIICVIVGFLLNAVQFSFMQDMSFVVTGDGLGGALDAANVLSTFTALSFVAGLIYVLFAKVFKRFTPVIAILLVGIAFAIAAVAPSLPVLFAAAAIFGLGFGFTNPALTLKAASCVTDPSKTPMAISIYVCGTGVGQFLSAYILTFITGTLKLNATRADWQVASISIIVGCAIGFVALALTGRKKGDA